MHKALVANSTTMTMMGKKNLKTKMVGRYFMGITICFGDGACDDRL
jgi:hypothetical protein